jgi:CubicO group peptidase (beta-lactamase class C family)
VVLACQNQKKEGTTVLIRSRIDSLLNSIDNFSGVVLVAEHGRPIYHKAVGFSNFETQIPLDTAFIFELASVSKQFTAMTVMMMEEEGNLAYDDLVEKFIPGLPYPGITIRHLLNHTSGLPDYQSVMDQHWDKTKVAGNDDNIQYLIKFHPEKLFEPGTKYEYSNTGYMLLASIVEKASGKDFIQFSRERIFTPLQMNSTDIRTRDEKIALPNMAWGHLYVEERQKYIRADSFPAFNYAIWLGNRKGPGRISSTTSDLLKWDQALYTERLVKAATLQEAFTPATLTNGTLSNYGFGWEIQLDSTLGKVVRHSGDNPGYKTHIVRYLDKNKTIILLCNNAHKQFDELLTGIEQLMH